MQVQAMQRIPIMMDAKRPTPRHIIIKRSKVKERLSKAREKKLVTRGCQMAGEFGGKGEEVRGL